MNEYEKYEQTDEDLKDVFKQQQSYAKPVEPSKSLTRTQKLILIIPPVISLIIFFVVSAKYDFRIVRWTLPISAFCILCYVVSYLLFLHPPKYDKLNISYVNPELSDFGRLKIKVPSLIAMILFLFCSSGLYLLL